MDVHAPELLGNVIVLAAVTGTCLVNNLPVPVPVTYVFHAPAPSTVMRFTYQYFCSHIYIKRNLFSFIGLNEEKMRPDTLSDTYLHFIGLLKKREVPVLVTGCTGIACAQWCVGGAALL